MANGNSSLSQLLVSPYWRYQPKLKGLSGVYLNTAIRNLAFGLMGIFIPIYLFNLTGSLKSVFFYFFLVEFFVVMITVPATWLISKIGPDLSMLLSNITMSINLLIFTLAKKSPSIIWLASLFEGITIPLYWLPYHRAFSSESKKNHLSKQIAKVSNITRLVTILAPLIGGSIATLLGIDALFPMGILLLIASSLPIFLDEYRQKESFVPLRKAIKNMAAKENKDLFLGFFFEGIATPLNTIGWPLILYLAIPSFQKIGGLATLTGIICLLVLTWFSKKINHFHPPSFTLGSIAQSLVWMIREIALANPLLIIVSDPIFSITTIFTGLSYNLLIYRLGKKRTLSFFVERELALHSGYMIANLVIIFLMTPNFSWFRVIYLTALATMLMNFFMVRYEQNKKRLFKPHFGNL